MPLFLIAGSRMFFPVGLIKFRRLRRCIISKLHDWCNKPPNVEDCVILFIHTPGIHLAGSPIPERFMYLMFRQQWQAGSPLKILSNQRSQAGECVESSEWTSFRSSKTPKTDSWRGNGRPILSTQLYYLPLVFFNFKWVRRKDLRTCSRHFVCRRCFVFAPPLDWWLINIGCQDQLKMNHKKLLTDTFQMERCWMMNISHFTAYECECTESAGAAIASLT